MTTLLCSGKPGRMSVKSLSRSSYGVIFLRVFVSTMASNSWGCGFFKITLCVVRGNGVVAVEIVDVIKGFADEANNFVTGILVARGTDARNNIFLSLKKNPLYRGG